MKFIPIKTESFLPPKDNIEKALRHLPKLDNGDIIFITSKILAIHQGRCVKITDKVDKNELIEREAEYLLPLNPTAKHKMRLAIKNHVLIPSSGIDESNGNGYYILWPRNVNSELKRIHQLLTKQNNIKNLGLVATDSHTTPLRRGVSGISMGLFGFEPVKDMRGTKDIFNRKLKYTQINIVDALTSTAVLLMGETNEQTPVVLLKNAKNIQFTTKHTYQKIAYPLKDDIYFPLLKNFVKKKRQTTRHT